MQKTAKTSQAIRTPLAVSMRTAAYSEIGLVSYPEAVAQSLILHAEKDAEFSEWLRSTLDDFLLFYEIPMRRSHGASGIFSNPERSGSELLLPRMHTDAIARTSWLLANILYTDDVSVYEKPITLLAGWTAEQGAPEPSPAPKNVVLGLKIGVLPIGLMGHMKIEEKMPIIARNDFLSRTDAVTLSKEAVWAGAGVLEQAFRAADGQARLLEPEISDWFTGEREAIFYTADAKSIREFLEELERLSIAYSAVEDENGPALLAVNPSINFSSLEPLWNMKAAG
ncbi:MAG: hypothetical protein HYT94_01750 [Parcubacteria group bacterium]|nr:hypothetical protein [Parcubacteria group bacterium]